MQTGKTAAILGGNGFIGHWMARRLKAEGYWVRVVDIKEYEYGPNDYADEIVIADLRDARRAEASLILNTWYKHSFDRPAFEERIQFDEVINFACLMGGANFVFTGSNDADIMGDSALININICNALANLKFKGKVFYSSSACVYPQGIQRESKNPGLKESDAWPADPDSCYGIEKLFSEKLYDAYSRNHKLDIRIARFHNIYGPEGTYTEPKSKAPAALCRKAILSKDVVEIWGDGGQTRSFLYISDCIDAVRLLMNSDHKEPINIGSEEMVSINELAGMAIQCSGKSITINHIDGPTGVRGRNSDNTVIRQVLNWEPKVSLQQGIYKTFQWIHNQINK